MKTYSYGNINLSIGVPKGASLEFTSDYLLIFENYTTNSQYIAGSFIQPYFANDSIYMQPNYLIAYWNARIGNNSKDKINILNFETKKLSNGDLVAYGEINDYRFTGFSPISGNEYRFKGFGLKLQDTNKNNLGDYDIEFKSSFNKSMSMQILESAEMK